MRPLFRIGRVRVWPSQLALAPALALVAVVVRAFSGMPFSFTAGVFLVAFAAAAYVEDRERQRLAAAPSRRRRRPRR